MSDTPRTDEHVATLKVRLAGDNEVVHADFARQLEREVAELKEKLKNSRDETIEWVAGQTKVQHCTPEWSLTDSQIRALKGKP